MIIALWIALIICVVWIALGEMPAGWDGHLPLPYLIALIPLLWIPTLVIAVAGFALHEPALGGGRCGGLFCVAAAQNRILDGKSQFSQYCAESRRKTCGKA